MKRQTILLLVVLLFTACHSTKKATETKPADKPLQSTHVQPSSEVKKQHSVVNFKAVVEGISVSGQARIIEDSAIWASAYKLLELGRILATSDSVWIDVPMMDKYFAGTYFDLHRITKKEITFKDVQTMLMSDNADEQIFALTKEMGYPIMVRITSRKDVDSLSMPFNKRDEKQKNK